MREGPATGTAGAWRPVRNVRGEFSVWPSARPLPPGWQRVGPPSCREEALDAAALAWRSRPADPAPLPGTGPQDTVDRRFARLAAADPGRLAVVEGDTRLSYRQLAERAGRLRTVLAAAGAAPGGAVGVCMDGGAELTATLLAVLASGAAYVPLDGGSPPARLAFMVRDAGVGCVVASPAYAGAVAAAGVPVVEAGKNAPDTGIPGTPPPALSTPDGTAYVMFTSGSTGRPKSVEVTHRNLTAFLDAMSAWLPPGAAARTLASTRLTFDIAGLEIFLPLVTGGASVVAPQTWLPRARSLARLVNSAAPTLVQATPVRWRMLLDAGARFGAGQTLLCGGDALAPALAGRLAALEARAFNVYGPTEASVWATGWEVGDGPVLVGGALPHARVHVLDDDLAPVPEGTEGEAYIAGPAVARGYRGQPRLTAERFVPDPWSPVPGARMYATGDVVRAVDGGLAWLRRRDTQVKVNGHRIELGEVEAAAAAADGVRAAAAVVHGDGGGAALALFVEGATPDAAELVRAVRGHLARQLPPAMLPRRIHVLAALPLTANGKVDRTALAARADGR